LPDNASGTGVKENVRVMHGPGPRGRGMGGKIDFKTLKKEKDIFIRLLGYIWKPYKFRLMCVFLCIIAGAVTSAAGNLFLQRLIDNYVAPLLGSTDPVFTPLIKAIAVMGCIYMAGVISGFLTQRLMIAVTQGTMKSVRDKMFANMQNLPVKFFDMNAYGDIMSRFTNDTDTLRQMISMSLTQTVSSLVSIVVSFIAMLSLSLPMTGVVIVMVCVMLITTGAIGSVSGKYFAQQQRDLADVNAYVEEMMAGQKVVKVFNHEEKVKKEFSILNDTLQKSATKAHMYGGILMPVNMNIGNLSYITVGLVGGSLAIAGIGGLTLGTIISFLTLTRQFFMPITMFSQQLNSVIMALAGTRRIFELMDEEPEKDDGDVCLVNVEERNGQLVKTEKRSRLWAWEVPDENAEGGVRYVKLAGDVRLKDVTFAYVEGKNVLIDINLYAKPGQKVAFVGHTGAGKTTITNLLNRFYDVQKGSIVYDGIDISRIRKQDLRHALGMVLQDTNLFTGTVMDNIRYGRLDATDEECIQAAKLANADEFINMLPDGYNTVLTSNGEGLSQGQRQLLNIARCAVADPPVMILDEATSSIDTRTEALVQAGMDALMEGRTVFVIAHRLSTIQNAKAIMVMENGRIIERGDHYDLIEQKGVYYKLYTGAFELD
jgi:ATP-binding cassette subfamily B multidrug efflux pump